MGLIVWWKDEAEVHPRVHSCQRLWLPVDLSWSGSGRGEVIVVKVKNDPSMFTVPSRGLLALGSIPCPSPALLCLWEGFPCRPFPGSCGSWIQAITSIVSDWQGGWSKLGCFSLLFSVSKPFPCSSLTPAPTEQTHCGSTSASWSPSPWTSAHVAFVSPA
jgi:hypothetical protein